ncbi:lipocalin-like domain-containing protein [Diaphorobacter aerolatus]|uniref:Carotenoid 1,2-hydratase n=1 Tax=Diaphorobacter aerolatus TaxID=1288495 RepID=A0A7H0GQ71_9BURK|nr:carotenoid 1,2-hydratase [Diaphorobacter aerolatus]QNP50437.1 carotenoid 1,2-hydratase [Diaphorobacter aerolatus]
MAFAARVLGAAAMPLLAVAPALALAPRRLEFPRDHGSHPELQTEWWYITGHARSGAGAKEEAAREFGFQVTFFRSRVAATQQMRSGFAARQLIFAHAAVTDLTGRKQYHDQRIARAGFGIAQASESDCDVRLRDWTLARSTPATQQDAAAHSVFTTAIRAREFELNLTLAGTQPLLLQGAQGLSRKGPDADQASYYYSVPQLSVGGDIVVGGVRHRIDARHDDPRINRAWMDHEWSEALMHPEAVGWDWIGMNLFDGSALTAFRLRRADGSALWAGGSWRGPDAGTPRSFGASEVRFEPQRHWQSPRDKARYPVEWQVATPVGRFKVSALLDDQELDSTGSTGAVYWEGLCDLLDGAGQRVGRGYLEMTGYAGGIRLN